jgi:tetratricopeptide (TPR) repeat protein
MVNKHNAIRYGRIIFDEQMKLTLIIVLFLISLNLAAQPVDDGYSERRFAELTEKLKVEPNNYELIWQRIDLSCFNHTYFDIYKKSGNLKGELSYFKTSTELFNDLNKLINNNVVIDKHNIAEFKMLRGRLYYFSGETDKALDDYLFALNYNPTFRNSELNDDIYISIAAYYYNLEDSLTEENARQALKYINMANPNGCHSNQTPDCYEREKKELLKFLKEEQRLINYYKELILEDYKSFVNTKIGSFVTTEYLFDKNRYYFSTLMRINDLSEFYNEIGNYQKAKRLTEQLIKVLPPDNNGKHYIAFQKEKIFIIANDEYNKRFFKLHNNKNYESTWDYLDLTEFIGSIKN